MKKTITIEKAIELMQNSSALLCDGVTVLFGNISHDEEDKNFLEISWEDEGNLFEFSFSEEKNKVVEVDSGSMWLEPNEDEGKMEIALLFKRNIGENGFGY